MTEPAPATRAPRRRRRRAVLAALAALVVAGTSAGAAVVALDGGRPAPAVSDDPLLRPTAIEWSLPTTTTAPPPGSPPLPQPTLPPEDPREDVPLVAAGEISIPRLGLAHRVFEGVWETVLDKGPGHWPGTAEPGGWGNAVYGGHRVTYSRPFRHLDRLEAGDEIVVRKDAVSHTYVVTDVFVVPPSALWIADQRPGRTITLFTCHPPGSAAERLVVRGELASSLPVAG